MYEAIYLPNAKRELEGIVDYISLQLKAPESVLGFIEAVDAMA